MGRATACLSDGSKSLRTGRLKGRRSGELSESFWTGGSIQVPSSLNPQEFGSGGGVRGRIARAEGGDEEFIAGVATDTRAERLLMRPARLLMRVARLLMRVVLMRVGRL